VAFIGVGILIVTLMGGANDPSDEVGLTIPEPIGPPAAIERSAAADILADKTWDEMTVEERALVRSEVERVFDDSTFRASNGFVKAVDIFRTNGETLASRIYTLFEAAGGQDTATQTIFYCDNGAGGTLTYRYIVSSNGNEFVEGTGREAPPPWSPIMTGASWDNVRDVGFREANGLTLHGLELDFVLPYTSGENASGRVEYWFDVETARLMERGMVVADDPVTTEANWYRVKYDELLPPQVPAGLEQPPCVQDILAAIVP
jgi:hypothetical protein